MAYIGKSPDGTGVRSRFYYTQTSGGGTSVTGSSDDGTSLAFSDGAYVDVYLNGVLLVAGTDYNTTTANTIAGLAALANGDVIEVVVYDIFTVADTVSSLNGGTFSNNVTINGDLTVDTNALFVDASANEVGIGTTTPATYTDYVSGSNAPSLVVAGSQPSYVLADTDISGNDGTFGITKGGEDTTLNNLGAGAMKFFNNGSQAAQISADGTFCFGTTTTAVNSSSSESGMSIQKAGILAVARSGGDVASFNRQTNDGTVIQIHQAGTVEGTISVSGSTVSYNGGHLSRWSQATDGNRIDGLVKGTVMTNLDQMAEWTKDGVTEDNEQLNCMAVSSVEGDANVAGVFVNWDDDDKDYTADMNVAMTGDMVIRIASGTTIARGDLLMSAGDGTAKPQGDDIVRSKTIAKVTSTTKSHTYDDGSYLVPCVLMAC